MSGVGIKMLILSIKTISKPISKRLKLAAADSERFKDVCILVGRAVNQLTHQVNVRLVGGKAIKLKPLGESEAVSRGAEVVGEGFVYGTSVLLLVGEYARRDYVKDKEKAEKAEKKRASRLRKATALALRFKHIEGEMHELRNRVKELEEEKRQRERGLGGVVGSVSSVGSVGFAWLSWPFRAAYSVLPAGGRPAPAPAPGGGDGDGEADGDGGGDAGSTAAAGDGGAAGPSETTTTTLSSAVS